MLLEAVAPELLLVMARLLLFTRLCVKAPSFYLNILYVVSSCSYSWIFQIQRDLSWMATFPQFSETRHWSVPEWVDHIRQSPADYRKSFLKVIRSPAANQSFLEGRVTSHPPLLLPQHCCHTCNVAFASKQALALHNLRKHGIKCELRRYVTTTHCLCCLMFFHSRVSVLHHVKDKSPICRLFYLAHIDPVSLEEANELDDLDTRTFIAHNKSLGVSRHNTGGKTCCRLQGPLQFDFTNNIGTHNPGRNYRLIGELPSL